MTIPLVFYLAGTAAVIARLLGYQPQLLFKKGSEFELILVICAVLIELWLTRGFRDSPESDAVRERISAESPEERGNRRRSVILYFAGSVVALACAVVVSRH